MKKERPIIFSTEMVKAILEGRKTVTRRLVKNTPQGEDDDVWINILASLCPYGYTEDILWVRESCAVFDYSDEYTYKADGYFQRYSAWERDILDEKGLITRIDRIVKWRPSIHMPKAAARIWLEITDIRVEKLHDITWQEIEAEGIVVPPALPFSPTHSELWEGLWVKINGQENFASNPWVWVILFKVLSTTGKPELQLSTKFHENNKP